MTLPGWQQPKTNWGPEDAPEPADFNRIESNEQVLATELEAPNRITTEMLVDGAVTNAKVANDANIAQSKISNEVRNIDAAKVGGCDAGTGAGNVLKLNSSGKVPVGNLPLYAKELHIPLCYKRGNDSGSYGAVTAGNWTFTSTRWSAGFTAYFTIVWSATKGVGGSGQAKVALRDVTAGSDVWSSTLSVPRAERKDRNAVTLVNGHTYQVYAQSEQPGQQCEVHEAKIELIWP